MKRLLSTKWYLLLLQLVPTVLLLLETTSMAVIATTAADASTDASSSSATTNERPVLTKDETSHDDEESVAIPPSPELTPEELQLVAEILNSNLTMSEQQDDDTEQDDKTQDDKDHHPPSVMTDQSLHDLFTNAQTEYKQWKTLLQQDIPALEKRRQSLTKRYETAKQETLDLLHLIQRRNQEEISSLMMRLQTVLQDELIRRESLSELESQYHSLEDIKLMLKQQQQRRRQQQQEEEEEEEEEKEKVNMAWSDPLTMDEIHGQINLHDITRTISETLGLNILKDLHGKMGYALSDYLEDCQHVTDTKMQNLQQDILIAKQNHIRNQEQVHQCVKVGRAANWIVSVLMQLEQSEKQSDALVHAKVVYGEKWTSDTFQPKTVVQLQKVQDSEEENQKEERRVVTLGDLHVQKYIPQDWERVLLPSGWKDWKVPSILVDGEKWPFVFFQSSSSTFLQNILPVSFWHSLPRHVVNIVESSSSSSSSSLEKTIPAPVETVLDPNIHLGSCWKMVGRNGRVTFRLKRPIKGSLESITIDHYPWLPSAHDPEEFWNHVSSAPRYMRVIGYPACEEEDVECREQIGFDVEHPIYMNSFEYKIDASLLLEHDGGGDLVENYKDEEGNVLPTSSSQTFHLSPVNLSPDDDDYNEEEEEDGDTKEKIATCDANGATCQREDKQTIENLPKFIAALTLTIDVNWGHPNYTCLYRVRVNEKE